MSNHLRKMRRAIQRVQAPEVKPEPVVEKVKAVAKKVTPKLSLRQRIIKFLTKERKINGLWKKQKR